MYHVRRFSYCCKIENHLFSEGYLFVSILTRTEKTYHQMVGIWGKHWIFSIYSFPFWDHLQETRAQGHFHISYKISIFKRKKYDVSILEFEFIYLFLLKTDSLLSFFCLGSFVPRGNVSLIGRHHHYQ